MTHATPRQVRYIEHLTLNTGHLRRSAPDDISPVTLARLEPWLRAAIASGQPAPLPADGLEGYTAVVSVVHGGLLCTVTGVVPLITFGVAMRSRQGAPLWEVLLEQPGVRSDLDRPAEPWCAALLLPGAMRDMPAMHWLGDFERCLAWTWGRMSKKVVDNL